MYSEKVMDHFQHPRNVGEIENASGVGTVGNAKCGDIMRIYLDIDDNGIIKDCKFKTFGCYASSRCGFSPNSFPVKSVRLCKHDSHFLLKTCLALNSYKKTAASESKISGRQSLFMRFCVLLPAGRCRACSSNLFSP